MHISVGEEIQSQDIRRQDIKSQEMYLPSCQSAAYPVENSVGDHYLTTYRGREEP
jgi:hypothetical protein